MHLFSRANQLTEQSLHVARMDTFSRALTMKFGWHTGKFSDFISIYKSQSAKQYPDPIENKAKKKSLEMVNNSTFDSSTLTPAQSRCMLAQSVSLPRSPGECAAARALFILYHEHSTKFPARAATLCLDKLSLVTSFLKGSSL